MLLVEKLKKMQIINEFKIEGFQNCQQYLKINPINILITDPKIQIKLLFYANGYKYRFIANSLYLARQYKKIQTQFLLLQTD